MILPENLDNGARPFPGARKSAALEAEDAFMELHGGHRETVQRSVELLRRTELAGISPLVRAWAYFRRRVRSAAP